MTVLADQTPTLVVFGMSATYDHRHVRTLLAGRLGTAKRWAHERGSRGGVHDGDRPSSPSS
jgi:hypothetical protein